MRHPPRNAKSPRQEGSARTEDQKRAKDSTAPVSSRSLGRLHEGAQVVSLEAHRNRLSRRAALLLAMFEPDQVLEARLWGQRRGA